mmetsp:Transcript_14729/g.18185  ORF Transcript_14729/g.18185 Transcript_14729/m.18185 type:complete len:279 (+) Transcript_14729:3-839(+)
MERLRVAQQKVSATDPLFWEKVGLCVGRSAEMCQEAWFASFTGEKKNLANEEEKRRAATIQRRVDRARNAIAEAASVAEIGQETSADEVQASQRTRQKLRRALRDLRQINQSLPELRRQSCDFDDNLFASLPSPPRLPSPDQHRKKLRTQNDINSCSIEEDDDVSSQGESSYSVQDVNNDHWQPAPAYLAALRRKKHSKKTTQKNNIITKKINHSSLTYGPDARRLQSIDAKIAKHKLDPLHLTPSGSSCHDDDDDDECEHHDDEHDDSRSHLLPIFH